MLHNALPSDTVARYGEIVDEWTASAIDVEDNAALIRFQRFPHALKWYTLVANETLIEHDSKNIEIYSIYCCQF